MFRNLNDDDDQRNKRQNKKNSNSVKKKTEQIWLICCPVLHNSGILPNKKYSECLNNG